MSFASCTPSVCSRLGRIAATAFLVAIFARAAEAQVVFSTDFESGLPAEFSAPGSVIEGVQGYAGLGPVGNQFSGSFLRYTSVPLFDTKLTLTGLPAHDHVTLGFLLAVIDSWDGTELFQVAVDGNLLFSHWFQLALGDASDYVAPPGALLSSGTDLGFTFGGYYYHDRAYNLAVEPAFIMIPHTSSSLEVVWRIGAVSGPAANQWQGGSDESWAIDNVRVAVSLGPTGVGGSGSPALRALSIASVSPNPFGSLASVSFETALPSDVTLEIYDVRGQLVRALPLGSLPRGTHFTQWDGRDARGVTLASGAYFARLRSGAETSPPVKMTIVR